MSPLLRWVCRKLEAPAGAVDRAHRFDRNPTRRPAPRRPAPTAGPTARSARRSGRPRRRSGRRARLRACLRTPAASCGRPGSRAPDLRGHRGVLLPSGASPAPSGRAALPIPRCPTAPAAASPNRGSPRVRRPSNRRCPKATFTCCGEGPAGRPSGQRRKNPHNPADGPTASAEGAGGYGGEGRRRPPLAAAGSLAPGRAANERGNRPKSGTQEGKPHLHRDRPFSWWYSTERSRARKPRQYIR